MHDKHSQVSAPDFHTKFCAPVKYSTEWIRAQEKKLGAALAEFPAWAKVKAALTADPVMRVELLRCMAGRIPLDKAEGIAECHMVIKKAVAYKADAEKAQAKAKEECEQAAREAEEQAAKEKASRETISSAIEDLLGSSGAVQELQPEDSTEDPSLKNARADALLKAGTIRWYRSTADLGTSLRELLGQLGHSHPLYFLVDCGAAACALADFLKTMAESLVPPACETWRATVIVGPMLAQVCTTEEKMKETFPHAGIFHTFLAASQGRSAAGRNVCREGPQDWALTAVHPAPVPVDMSGKRHFSRKPVQDFPFLVTGLPKKQGPEDNASFTCKGNCGFRGTFSEPDPADLATVGCEVVGEDQPCPAEPVDGEPVAAEIEPVATANNTPKPTRWTFTRSTWYYTKVIKEVLMPSTSGTLVIMTTTGNPNAAKAAAACGFSDTRVLAERIPEHQQWHGEQMLQEHFFEEFLKNAAAAAAPAACKTLLNTLQCISAYTSHRSSTYDPWDIPVDFDACDCAGLDLVYKDTRALPAAFNKEAAHFRLEVATSGVSAGHQGVFTKERFPEGHCFGPVTALYFSSPELLWQFLTRTPAHSMYADRVVVCRGVEVSGMEVPVYAVLVGIAGEIMHHVALAPDASSSLDSPPCNVQLSVNPAAGFTRGFLTLIVATNNGAGIKAGGELLLDYGPDFDVSVPMKPTVAAVPRAPPKPRQARKRAADAEDDGEGDGRRSRRRATAAAAAAPVAAAAAAAAPVAVEAEAAEPAEAAAATAAAPVQAAEAAAAAEAADAAEEAPAEAAEAAAAKAAAAAPAVPRGQKRSHASASPAGAETLPVDDACWPEGGTQFAGESSLVLKSSDSVPPTLFLAAEPVTKKVKIAKDTVIIKSTGGSFTHESMMKKEDASFSAAESAIPVQWKSSTVVVVLNEGDAAAPPRVTTLEKAWRQALQHRGSVTLWNALQCDLTSAEEAADDKAKCNIEMKTAIIYVPAPGDDAMRHLIKSGWAPKKSTRWISAWSVKDGVFSPVGGLWLLTSKGMQVPCEI